MSLEKPSSERNLELNNLRVKRFLSNKRGAKGLGITNVNYVTAYQPLTINFIT